MGMLNSNEPTTVTRLQKLANQSLLNGALVMEMVNNSISESKNNIVRLIKGKKFQSKKIKIWKYTSTRFCSQQRFGNWMYFRINLSLWEVQVIKDLLCIRDIAGKSLNMLLLLLILKKIKFHWNELCWSLFLIKLHAWVAVTFFRKQLTASSP